MKNRYFIVLLTGMLLATNASAQLQEDTLRSAITIGYEHYHFDKQFPDDWQVGSLEYKNKPGSTTFIGRFNYAHRLGRTGWQAEAEAYPKISRKIYSYIGLGYSPSVPVFSKLRTGATLFFVLPKGWEAEGGFRQLYFDRNIWIGTAGASKYVGNWLFNLRSFIGTNTPSSNHSVFLTARRYLQKETDFLWLQLGNGISPDESRNVLIDNDALLSSRRISAGANISISKHYGLETHVGWSHDEIGSGRKGYQMLAAIRLSYRFR